MTSRRNILKSLLFLPAISYANNHTSKEPVKKFIFINNSLGFYSPNFLPEKQGKFNTSTYLKEFKHPDKMTLFENLYHPGMDTSNHASEKSILTGAQAPEASVFRNTISIDQVLMNKLGPDTRFQSLSLSTGKRGISWNAQGGMIPPVYDESTLYKMLFVNGDKKSEKAEINNQLNIIKSNLKESKNQTGFNQMLAAYEKEKVRQKAWLDRVKKRVEYNNRPHTENAFEDRLFNIFDLAYLALSTDSTRIITINIPYTNSPIKVKGLPAPESWHSLSHHGKKKSKIDRLSVIEQKIIKAYSQLLNKLEATKEGKSSMLDNTLVFMGSDMGQASTHKHDSLPTLVAGGGFNHKQHIINKEATPLCNLYLELLNHGGCDMEKFSTSTGVGQWLS